MTTAQTPDSKSKTSAPNEFIKGFVWGFVAFVHFAAITVIIFKLKLNCLPTKIVEMIACTPPGSAKCAVGCDPSNDMLFYIVAGATALALIFLPIAFGIMWVVRFREASQAKS